MPVSAVTEEVQRASKVVGVGFYAGCGYEAPMLPGCYDLQTIDAYLHAELNTFQICLIAADSGEIELLLEDAARVLGVECYLIAMTRDLFDISGQQRLLELGADDVVFHEDRNSLLLALARAEKALDRQTQIRLKYMEAEEERANLQSAIDNLPSPIFYKDRRGIYSGCNKAFSRLLGLPQNEIVGSTVFDIAPSELAVVYHDADEELMQSGGTQIYDSEVRYVDGEVRHVTFHKGVTRDRLTGEINGIAGAILDVTERKELENRLQRLAERDDLTGAYNRRKFFGLAEEKLIKARAERRPVSVFVVDIDRFKQINDRYGHACGDKALLHMVGLLEHFLPENAHFARAGGEEFFCLLEDAGMQNALIIAEDLREAVSSTPFMFEGFSVFIQVSIGVAEVDATGEIGKAVIRADQALYKAKNSGRNRVATS